MMNPVIEVIPHCEGGDGQATFRHLKGACEMPDSCKLYAEITVYPGSSIGWHEHHGDSEIYYVLSGTAEYNDNGEIGTVTAGDVTICPTGTGHGIANKTDEVVELVAVIVYA